MTCRFKYFIIYRVWNRMVLFKQNYSIFLMKFKFGNFSLPFIFCFPFLSLLSEYNRQKHSWGFHSCLPSWPDELGKGKTSVNSSGSPVKTGVLWASNTSGVFQRHRTNPSVFWCSYSLGNFLLPNICFWFLHLTSLSREVMVELSSKHFCSFLLRKNLLSLAPLTLPEMTPG